MIKIEIKIEQVTQGPRNNLGAGVRVLTSNLHLATDAEGETWVGLCKAINAYMNESGAPDFDCLKRVQR